MPMVICMGPSTSSGESAFVPLSVIHGVVAFQVCAVHAFRHMRWHADQIGIDFQCHMKLTGLSVAAMILPAREQGHDACDSAQGMSVQLRPHGPCGCCYAHQAPSLHDLNIACPSHHCLFKTAHVILPHRSKITSPSIEIGFCFLLQRWSHAHTLS